MFGTNKPFGTASAFGNSTFGNTTTPFGQPTNTAAFGAKPATGNVFGSSTFGTTTPSTGGLFGSTAPTPGAGLFGQNTFGQPVSTSGGGSFAFGGGASTTGGLFGTTTPATQSTGLFGGSGTSAFGSPRPAFGGFGGTTTSTGLFGQTTNTGTGLFGGSTGFGNTVGTTVKFNPPTGTDTMMKGGVTQNINTRHQCISCMKEYENKSLEELRLEDYTANRKGPQPGGMTGFGPPATQTGLFGAPAASTAGFSFGTTQAKPLFGTTTGGTNTFGSTGAGLFGQPAQPQNTGIFGKSVSFGTTTTAAPTFAFGNTGNTSLFGQNNQAKPLFGQPTAGTGLFGQQPTSQPQIGFGTGTGFGAFGATSQPSTGLFGAKSTGAATTNTFSFGNTAVNSGGLFGQKSTAPAFGTNTGFGATNTFGAFGTTQASNTGLFGQPKAGTTAFGTTSTGFGTGLGTGFGASPFTSMGMNTNTGTGLFGSTLTNKPTGFNFPGTSGNTFGFGQTTGLGAGFNCNINPTPAIANDPNAVNALQQQLLAQQVFAFKAYPYGDNPLFRNSLKDPKRREELLKPTNPAAQKAALTIHQFKISPFPAAKIKPKPLTPASGKVSLFDGLEDEEPSLGSTSFIPKQSVKKLILKSHSASPSFTVTSNLTSTSGHPTEISFSTSILLEKSPSRESGSKGDTSQNLPFTVDASEHRPLTNSNELAGFLRSPINLLPSSPVEIKPKIVKKKSPEHSLNDTIEALHTKPVKSPSHPHVPFSSFDSSTTTGHDSLLSSPGSSPEDDEKSSSTVKIHRTGICLTKSGYYTHPPLDDLILQIDKNNNCFIEDFVVGREGYGCVRFLGLTNVMNLNLDEIVSFRRKEITVYPDDDNKPPVGEGLNKRAEITLHCVWPTDKTTHSPIKDPARLRLMGYMEKIEKSTARLGAKFLDYKPESGSWVFQVEHFSKYGLEDSDDDSDDPKHLQNATAQNKKMPAAAAKDRMQMGNKIQFLKKLRTTASDDDDEMHDADAMMTPDSVFTPLQHLVTAGLDSERIQGMKASFFLTENDNNWENPMEIQEPIAHFGSMKTLGQFPKPVPVKRSTVDSIDGSYSKNSVQYLDESRIMNSFISAGPTYGKQQPKLSSSITLAREEIWSAYPVIAPMASLKTPAPLISRNLSDGGRKVNLRPFNRSLVYDKQKCLADMGFYMGRSFRVGWAPKLVLLHLGQVQGHTEDNGNIENRSVFGTISLSKRSIDYNPFTVSMSKIQILGDVEVDDLVKRNLVQSLKVQLEYSKSLVEDQIPVFVPKPGIESLHAHARLSEKQLHATDINHSDSNFVKQCNHVWELCVALWGEIPGLESDKTVSAYAQQMARRESLSKWLIKTTKEKVISEINDNSFNSNHLSTIFTHLTARDISKAVLLAQESNDHCLATLLAQAEGNALVRRLVNKQLADWDQCQAYGLISRQRLKLYVLLAGLMVWAPGDITINCCENLDWRRALAVHLWYACLPTASIKTAVLAFETSFSGEDGSAVYTDFPVPPYFQGDAGDDESGIFDTCYHLLQLYCDHSYRLDKLLMPESSTPAHTDYRLSWLLHQTLSAIGYCHLPFETSCLLNLDFSSQLESMGLWHWAIFIVLHFPNAETRTKCVKDILLRHVSLHRDDEMEKGREAFLQEKLLIPSEWIYQAKAIKARSFGVPADEAWFLLKAGCWSQSHEIIIRELAADAIINENYDYLLKFLKELAPPERSETILDWASGGQVFLDYIHVSQMVDSVVKGDVSAYDVEKLHPEVVSLCQRLSNIQCRSAKDRLCQSEMAKKTATLLRAVFTLQAARSGNQDFTYTLIPYIKSLPMPEDYALQELRELARGFLTAVTAE